MERRNYNRKFKREGFREDGKSSYDREQTHEEVKQIKRNLINVAKSSWGKQWISSILERGRPFRMQRGIKYAKEDRIENLTIKKGQIFATVQGTAPTPYRVKINFDIIPDEQWKIIIKALTNKAINLIELLEGNLPQEIIAIFEENGYPIFLDSNKDLDAECSCPDKAIPCKHIAATIIYIALVIDYNPLILLKLRGKSKDDILKILSLSQRSNNKLITEDLEDIKFTFNIPKISIQEISNFSQSDDINKIGFQFKSTKIIDTLENLGIPPNLENPKAFETVLRAIYSKITSEIYKNSMKLRKSS